MRSSFYHFTLCTLVVLSSPLGYAGDGLFRRKAVTTCTSSYVKQSAIDEQQLKLAEGYLDDARKRLEEWGTITVSSPVIMTNVQQFDLGTDFQTAGAYIEDAKKGVQGGVAESTKTNFGNGLNFQIGAPGLAPLPFVEP